MEERTPVNSSDFLEETIKTRPRNRKRIIRRVFEVALLAVLFGLIACVTMLIVSPVLEEKLFPTPSNEVIFTEETMSHASEEIQPEDMLLEDKVPETSIIVEVPDIETQLLQTIYLIKQKAKECENWLVEVSGVSNEVSWLESTSTSANVATGAIIADNGTELLVLVELSYIQGADKIVVTFVDDTSAAGYKKGEDFDADLAVVAVPKEHISEATLEACSVVEMASSNSKSLVSSVVMALGSPNGITRSTDYGFITASGVEANGWDVNYKLVMTDMYGSTKPNGFLVNLRGQLVGILCNEYNEDDVANMITALGISDLKKKIERMSNADSIPVLGIKGTEVTAQAQNENGIPSGAYVLSVKMDSPAMHAGIQAGDVIVQLGEKDITSMDSLSYHLYQLKVGSEVSVVIMRKSQGTYKESTLNIVLSNQN